MNDWVVVYWNIIGRTFGMEELKTHRRVEMHKNL